MLHIIINPAAGNGLADRVGTDVLQALEARGIAYTASRTERDGHAVSLARAAAGNGASTVVAVGGDGTVSEAARGLVGTATALGVIPAGTGNDIAKMLGVPRKPREALAFLLDHPARPLDIGYINGEPFLNVCGTGFDVCVLDYALSAKRYVRGLLPYLWGVLRAIFTFRSVEAAYTVEEGPLITERLLLVSVANGQFIGGGIPVAPMASPDDGYLDMIVIGGMPNWRMPFQLLKLMTGRIMKIPGARVVSCRSATIACRGMRVNVDGEILPMDKASFSLSPGAVRVHW